MWSLGVLWTARTPDAGAGWRFAFVAFALAGAGWLWWTLRHWDPSREAVLGLAIALRIVVFPLDPVLSDDGYRYIWDGMLQAQEAVSPYLYRPSDAALGALHGEVIYARMNSPDYYSVYPPVSQMVFALGGVAYGAGWRVSWWVTKGLIVLAELAGLALLIAVVGPRAAAVYAWHPLAVFEIAGQGHTEGLLVGALGLLLWSTTKRPVLAGTAVAIAGWVKLYPFAFALLVLRWAGWKTLVAVAGIAVGLAAPYFSCDAAGHIAESLNLYAGTFDFYSAPYLMLKSVLFHEVSAPGRVAAGLLTVGWGGVLVALVTTGDLSSARSRWSVAVAVSAFALTSPTVHPWHWIAPLFVSPLLQNTKTMLWLITISLMSYIAYVWELGLGASVWAGWGGAALLWWRSRRPLKFVMYERAEQKWRRIAPHVPCLRPGARILDLGSGEGYVGEVAAQSRGVAVSSADVVEYGSSRRQVDLYNGETLPYSDGQFDATIVVYVLHHAERPAAVIKEAIRVTSGVVVVLETVWVASWQKPWLERLDRLVNRLRSGAAIDEGPLDIRSDEEWRRLFEQEDLALQYSETIQGPHPQALYVLSGSEATTSITS